MLAETISTRLRAIHAGCAPGPLLTKRAVMLDALLFTHRLIVASGPLLLVALDSMRRDVNRDGEFGAELIEYLDEHWWEENRHAEWLARDLATADIDPSNWTRWEPRLDAAEIAGSQYYLARHVHPCALLGYMAALELPAMTEESLTVLEQIHGEDLLRTLRHHIEVDPQHYEDLTRIIDRVPEQWHSVVYSNAVWTQLRLCAAGKTFGEGDEHGNG